MSASATKKKRSLKERIIRSPYASPSCKIYFKTGQPFTIPRDLISERIELDKICNYLNEIRIQDVPDEAGHVLVHYLYTGTWQTLSQRFAGYHSEASNELQIAVHVYAAARAYDLPVLVELAQVNIFTLAAKLSALDVLVSAAGGSALLPDDDPWFLGFTRMYIERLFEDPASINQSVLLGCCNDGSTYSKMVVKTVIQICCENAVTLKSVESRGSSEPEPPVPSETDASDSTGSALITPDSALDPDLEILSGAKPEDPAEMDLETKIVLPETESEAATPKPEPVLGPKSECEPEPRTEVGEDFEVTESSNESKRKHLRFREVAGVLEPVLDGEDDICADRATHVLHSGWERCISCRAGV